MASAGGGGGGCEGDVIRTVCVLRMPYHCAPRVRRIPFAVRLVSFQATEVLCLCTYKYVYVITDPTIATYLRMCKCNMSVYI